MWTRFSLMRWLLLLAIWLLSCSGCSAADWTVTRTHAHPLAELRARRAAPPQVVVVQVPAQMPAAPQPSPSVTVEREQTPAIPRLVAPLAPAVPLVAAPTTMPTIPAPVATPRKRITVQVEK